MSSAISVKNASVKFQAAGGDLTALDDVSLEVPNNQFVSVIGANGAGKSTLIALLSGSVRSRTGSITMGGFDVTQMPEHKRSSLIARVRQSTTDSVCTALSVEENLSLALTSAKRPSVFRSALTGERKKKIEAILEKSAPHLLDRRRTKAGKLSGGQRQLLALLMAVATDAPILLLDEHTSALDPSMAEEVMSVTAEAVSRNSLTAIMITHNMSQASKYGDRLLMLSQGKIVGDLEAAEREKLGESGLVDLFREKIAEGLADSLI